MTGWPFGTLRPGAARVILADPPWQFLRFTAAPTRKAPEHHYPTMTFAAICALPVQALAHDHGAMLLLWTTFPFLEKTFVVLRAWGATYSTGGAWIKQGTSGKLGFGPGHTFRENAEPFLLARFGAGAKRRETRAARSQRNGILAPGREHSRKPDQLAQALEAMFPGPYVELFARRRRDGWASWGNEIDSDTTTEAIARERDGIDGHDDSATPGDHGQRDGDDTSAGL
jgi:N6-adenosine-specific RNA methylase IME4